MRRLIREQRGGEPLVDLAEETEEQEKGGGGGSSHDPFGPLKELLGSEAEFLFDDPLVWASISKPLARMSVNEIDILMKRLNISKVFEKIIFKIIFNFLRIKFKMLVKL